MSSSHIIIVARNDKTGELKLPLEHMTLYGVGGEEDVLRSCCAYYGPDWTLTLYEPKGDSFAGTRVWTP